MPQDAQEPSFIPQETDAKRLFGAGRMDSVNEERRSAAAQIGRTMRVWRKATDGGADEEKKDEKEEGAEAKEDEEAKDGGAKEGEEGEKDEAEVEEKPADVSAKLYRSKIYRNEDDKNKQPHPNKPPIPDEAAATSR